MSELIKVEWTYAEPRDVWGHGTVSKGDRIEVTEKLCKQLQYQGFIKRIKEKKVEKKNEVKETKGGK